MADDPRALKLYIDGNCYGNPGGNGAIACVAHFPEDWNRGDEIVFEEGFHETTNNRMELSACIRALEYVAEKGASLGVERVVIVTDSQYVDQYYKQAATWRSNKWRTSVGRPVENSDLWKRFLSARHSVRIRTDIIWKKGKKTPTLKMVDGAAKSAGKSPQRFDRGFRAGKVAHSKVSGGSSLLYAANGQSDIIRIYRSAMIGKTAHKITFDRYDETRAVYVEKCRAYTDAATAALLHRQHCYRVKFNSEPKHPMIEEIIEELACSSLEFPPAPTEGAPAENVASENQQASRSAHAQTDPASTDGCHRDDVI
jgi:ribonuclease HI